MEVSGVVREDAPTVFTNLVGGISLENYHRHLSAVVLFFASTAPSAWAQQDKDVLGIALGTSFDKAVAAMRGQYPQFKTKTVAYHVPERHEAQTFSEDPEKRGAEQIVLAATQNKSVWFIGRALHFKEGDRPKYEDMLQSLTKKFGPPSIPPLATLPNQRTLFRQPRYGIVWKFDDQGKLITLAANSQSSSDPCSNTNQGSNISSTTGADLIVPAFSGEHCGTVISATMQIDKYTSLLSSLTITIQDAQAMLNDPLLGASTRELIANKKKLIFETKKNNVPNF